MATDPFKVQKDINQGGEFTDWLDLSVDFERRRFFSVSVRGTFDAKIIMQYKRFDWLDTEVIEGEMFTNEAVETFNVVGKWFVRAGCKDGDYTSGTAKVELSRT